MHPRHLKIEDFTYDLPDERIAHYPLSPRDSSKLLVNGPEGIVDDHYRNLPDHIPTGSLMVFNQTRVVHARLIFTKSTGSLIEVFCLEPGPQYPDITTAMAQKGGVEWQCLVGGASKWKNGQILQLQSTEGDLILSASIKERRQGSFIIQLTWDQPDLTFAEVLHQVGKVPLPPYLNREAAKGDEETYQTIFARQEGSVAAPTAGLHFTDAILAGLAARDIEQGFVTLHVGAGTFKPVKSDTIEGHDMHSEWLEVDQRLIQQLINHLNGNIVAVGTTSMRTLESLYWIGNKLHHGLPVAFDKDAVTQWEPYDTHEQCTPLEALQALSKYLTQSGQEKLITRTQILIAPSYKFKLVNNLVTNFHQPHSTLLLLVAAFIGPSWQALYDHALNNNYRFLSYGDGMLLYKRDD